MIETEKKLTALCEEFVEVTCRHDPVWATEVGLHDYDHQLPDVSPEGYAARAAWVRDFRGRVEAEVGADALSTTSRVELELLRSRVAALASDLERVRAHTWNPEVHPELALRGVFLLLARPFAPFEERKEAILDRLMAVPDLLDGARATLGPVSDVALKAALEILATAPGFVDDVVRTLLRSFGGEAERIEHAGARARTGFLRYQEWAEKTLATRMSHPFAIGEDAMNERLRDEHRLTLDCAALEQLGREQIELARRALVDEARRIDPRLTWQEQIVEARRRHPEANHLREAYARQAERARTFVLDRRVAPLPEGRLEVVETPTFERFRTPYAAYLAPAAFDEDTVGLFYVTPIDLSRPRPRQREQLERHANAWMPLTVAHEAYPGHHLQLLHANRAASRLRRVANSPLFCEGWALYVEELMHELGYFDDPATRLFNLRDLLWRACRVVIDVGLQAGRMTFAEATELLTSEVLMDPAGAEAEVRRYALTPTEPLSYLVGKLEILALRDEAKRRLGPAFDLYSFHAALLAGGSLPPALVRQEIEDRLVV